MKTSFLKVCSRLRMGLLAGGVAVAVSSLAVNHIAANDAPKVTTVALNVSDTQVQRDGHFITSFAPVVKKIAPSVVKVEVFGKKTPATQSPASEDEFLRKFFGEQFGQRGGRNNNNNGRSIPRPREFGLGSGVIVSKDGYLLTNNHVVEEADEIKVTLADGREFNAKVIGRDPKTDIAVIKIDAKDLTPITIADSDKIEIGDIVLAAGNPFGIGQSVTMGMISATGRGNVGIDYEDFIQTDAAINPGNSGGALVDAEGRLIGINTAILSRSGGYQGIGFAVPINLARGVMESLIKNGRVVRGFLGVGIQDVTPTMNKSLKLSSQNGAIVGEVSPDSPASKAGLKTYDVITSFNNRPVTDSRQLRLQVAQTAPGSTVPVKVLRDGKEQIVKVTLKELPGADKSEQANNSDTGSDDSLHGVTVGDIDAQVRSQLGIPQNIQGAVITDVDQDSAAYDAGLRPGDVVQEINRQPVRNSADAVKLTQNLKDKTILLRVWGKRGDSSGSRFVVVDESNQGK